MTNYLKIITHNIIDELINESHIKHESVDIKEEINAETNVLQSNSHLNGENGKRHDKTSPNWYRCTECNFRTKYKRSLLDHNRNKHEPYSSGNRKFKCSKCCYTTKHRGHLNRHVTNSHTKLLEMYRCADCVYETSQKNNLKRHVGMHMKGAPFHRVYAPTVKKFTCTQCPFATNFQGNLKRHVREQHQTQETVRTFICEHCPYIAKRNCELQVHRKKVHRRNKTV